MTELLLHVHIQYSESNHQVVGRIKIKQHAQEKVHDRCAKQHTVIERISLWPLRDDMANLLKERKDHALSDQPQMPQHLDIDVMMRLVVDQRSIDTLSK